MAEYTVQPSPDTRDKCHPEDAAAPLRAPGPPPEQSRNWKLTLAYDGSDFSGWQVQPGLRTVQGELAEAIGRITGEIVLPQGSGRTDAGVHALGQVASFTLRAPIPAQNLLRALRFSLPRDVEPIALEAVPPHFHARHSAVAKTYEYRVHNGPSCSPFLSRYVHNTSYTLDLAAMQAAARAVEGEHDFTSFAASDPDRSTREPAFAGPAGHAPAALAEQTAVRRILSSQWQQRDGLLVYCVTGSGFLHHMVRNLVGTFLEVGRGLRSAASLPQTLAARTRSAAGATAPASGLFLVHVEYREAQ